MKIWQKITLIIIFLLSFCIQIYCAKDDSLTTDETVHLTAGFLHVVKGDYNYNPEHPPLANDLSGLFVWLFVHPKLPDDKIGMLEQYHYGDKFIFDIGNSPSAIIFWARFPIILLFLLLLYLIFLWSRKLWGINGALLSTLLAAFCPNLLAHGHLATTDLILSLTYTLNFYLLYRYIEKPTIRNALFFALGLGILLLSKFSGLIGLGLDIIFYILLIWYKKNKWVWKNFWILIFCFGFSFFIVWLIYAFSLRNDWRAAVGYYHLNHFIGLSWFKNCAKWLVLPLKQFWDGFWIDKVKNDLGHLSYINGIYSYLGQWFYFPYVFIYKTPFSLIILYVLALISALSSLRNKIKPELLLVILAPIIFFLFSMMSHINLGIRHILPIYPFIYILIGGLATLNNIIIRWLTIILVIISLYFSFKAFPDYISYLNNIAFYDNRPKISDSNYDWNQNLIRFKKTLDQKNISKIYFICFNNKPLENLNINVESIPKQPTKGFIALCGYQYQLYRDGMEGLPEYNWFLQNKPTEIFRTIYIWDYR